MASSEKLVDRLVAEKLQKTRFLHIKHMVGGVAQVRAAMWGSRVTS
jgi:hypothetical protein